MRGRLGLTPLALLALACGMTVGAYSQPLVPSPYHAPRLTTWRELQQKLGNGDYQPPPPPERHDPQCELPEAPPDSLMVQLSALQGAALSTATIGSQDVETSTAQVKVAAGRQPLYLVISSATPVIWRFSGAVDRVRRLILSSETGVPGRDYDPMPLVGEIGVPEERVFTVRRRGCLHAFDGRDAKEAALAAEFVHHQSGRAVEIQTAAPRVSSFSIPTGPVEATESPVSVRHILGLERPDEALRYELANSWPDGVTAIRADRVVASRAVEPYRILPGAAGLQQLVKDGTLAQLSSAEFAVRRGFHFPAGIAHGVNADFLLGAKFGSNPACRFERDGVRDVQAGVTCD